MQRMFLLFGATFGFLAVALGAFGAHAIKGQISTEMLAVFQTGVQYQAMHAIALLLVAVLSDRLPEKQVRLAGYLFAVGIVIFSGSLYALSLTGVKALGAITPLGGLAFMGGWLSLVYAGLKMPAKS